MTNPQQVTTVAQPISQETPPTLPKPLIYITTPAQITDASNASETFLELVTETSPRGTEARRFHPLLKGLGFKFDTLGSAYLEIPLPDGQRSSTAFTAHMDDVSRAAGPTGVQVNTVAGARVASSSGNDVLGADDKTGLALVLSMVKRKIPGHYMIFVDEERGRVGSKSAAEQLDVSHLERMIAFDRRGKTSVVHRMNTRKTASIEFAQALAQQLNSGDLKFVPDPNGAGCDALSFAHLIPECTNISVGYENPHRVNETQDLDFLDKLAAALGKIKWEELPVKRNPEEQWTKTTGGFGEKAMGITRLLAHVTQLRQRLHRRTRLLQWKRTIERESELAAEVITRMQEAHPETFENIVKSLLQNTEPLKKVAGPTPPLAAPAASTPPAATSEQVTESAQTPVQEAEQATPASSDPEQDAGQVELKKNNQVSAPETEKKAKNTVQKYTGMSMAIKRVLALPESTVELETKAKRAARIISEHGLSESVQREGPRIQIGNDPLGYATLGITKEDFKALSTVVTQDLNMRQWAFDWLYSPNEKQVQLAQTCLNSPFPLRASVSSSIGVIPRSWTNKE